MVSWYSVREGSDKLLFCIVGVFKMKRIIENHTDVSKVPECPLEMYHGIRQFE